MQMDTHEKKAVLANREIKLKPDCETKVVEQSAEEKEVVGWDEESKENLGDSPQRWWPEILQPCPETVTDTNLQVGEEMETHHINPPGKAGRTAGRVPQHVPQEVNHTDRPLALSDGDYASDKPSGTENNLC